MKAAPAPELVVGLNRLAVPTRRPGAHHAREERMFYVIKLVLSAGLIVLVSELAKRSSFFGGLVASVPVVSLLAMIWLYIETGETSEVANLSRSIFWLVLPSLSLFVILPVLLKNHIGFYLALALSTTVMLGCYGIMLAILGRVGIRL